VSSVISIQDARQSVEGADVRVRGVVTRVMRQKNFFIQQGDFAITVYGYVGSETIVEGDFVEVYGFIGIYNGLVQLTGAEGSGLPEVTKLTGTAPTITPLELTESTYDNDALKLNNDGRLISIKGLKLSASFTPLVIDQSQADGNANATFKLGAKNVDGRFDRYINVPGREGINTFFKGMSTATKFDYQGILGEFSTGIQLQVTDDSDFTLNTDPAVLPTAITVTSPVTPVEVVVGLGLKLGTTVLPENADDKSVTWSSSDIAIATVSSTGLVSGESVGTAVITATSEAAKLVTGTISVSVTPAPLTLAGVEFGVGDQSLKVGQSVESAATLRPLGYVGQGITYTSSDTAIATVTSAGVIEARAAGTATITAAATEDNTKTDTLAVTVADVMTIADAKIAVVNTVVTVNGVITRIIASNELFIQVGVDAVQVAGAQTAGFASGDFVQVTGPTQNSSTPRRIGGFSGSSIASMTKITFLSAPEVTPLVLNESTLNTTSTSLSNQWRLVEVDGLFPTQPWVDVESTSVTRVFKLGALNVDVRISGFILAQEKSSLNALFTDFWKNDTVNFEGILNTFTPTGGSPGYQLYTSGGSDFTLVEADPVLVSSITVTGAAGATSLAANGELQLAASVLPANADVLGVTWSSSSDAIATVDASGLVSGVSVGSVTITATSREAGSTVVGTIELTITEPLVLTGILLSADPASIGVGSTTQITVTPTPSAWVGSYTYVSDTPAVATVSDSGLVTGVSVGSAIITATSFENNSISSTITINVIEGPMTSFDFSTLPSGSSEYTDPTAFLAVLRTYLSGTDVLSSVSGLSKIYPATVTQGPLLNGIKTGTASAGGTMTLNLLAGTNVTKVVIVASSWSSTTNDTISINGSATQIAGFGELVPLEFDLTATDTLAFTFKRRVVITSIELYA
jgi:uncharacterized protein YjdB